MGPERVSWVTLRPRAGGDLSLLCRPLGDPAMMEHLGGPETPEHTEQRHQRFLAMADQPGARCGWTGGLQVPPATGRGVARVGVRRLGAVTFGDPKGHFMRCHDWVCDLGR